MTLTRILSFFTLLLVACTWRLWFAASDFPMVPWLPVPALLTPWLTVLDRFAATCLVAALAGLLLAPATERGPAAGRAWWVALVAMGWLVLTNQHRLQPWAYHFLVSGWILLSFPRLRANRLLLTLLCSVYLFSAWNKVDQRFLATTGELMMRTAAGWFRADARTFPPGYFSRAAWLLPLGETLLAVGLALPGTRGKARWLALGMHGGLLGVLGPYGLNQRWGVLIWNLSFAAQAWYLASCCGAVIADAGEPIANAGQEGDAVGGGQRRGPAWRWVPLVAALVMPLLEPWNLWDHWPSWGLYSARAARLELMLPADAAANLPSSLQPFLDARTVDGVWRRLALDRWSLESLDAPLYPQTRFQWGVCRAVLEASWMKGRPMMVVEHLSPERWTGRGERRAWGGVDAVTRATRQFWFNTRPRPVPAGGEG